MVITFSAFDWLCVFLLVLFCVLTECILNFMVIAKYKKVINKYEMLIDYLRELEMDDNDSFGDK